MIDSNLRSKIQGKIFDPVAKKFAWATPTQLTLLGAITGITSGVFIAWGYPLIAILLLLTSGLFDVIDGSVARLTNRASETGATFDISMDRLVEASVVIGLCFFDPPARSMYGLFMLASILICVTTFLVVGIFSENESRKSFHYSPGLMERTEAFIFFIAMIALPQYFTGISVAFSLLVAFTGFYRLWQFLSFSKG